ncbi:hydrolase of the HAD superfamily protein [Amylolactobacillus amylotrophicus DSM 20534]|uniref:Hydrolase n=3 Tax=Amylolactobacillus TaxID=2767876 RepID=A0A1L6XBT9_9LACO|nr:MULTISPECIES: YfbR-like 5'-deoxynucleotidase [Amylolactobacillus]APT18448.1 hydrolase [Amylolactobacillus amylophilus DSM 20533 = JCM 1125]KRK38235.1 hydrolase of the HAD superfamily protein [Amylolactobacillus amylotrophicus DSM 20534]KRM43123.1 hydrolase of the HAD superfamily protein [Amylolactobacillus amylophilus DSM 20533 = JCM 1125]GED80477.1 hydrolase [Amylolactobacillus amylophilus]
MGLHEFIQGLNNLETIDRAPGYFKYQQHTVAAHSFRVAEIAQMLGDIEEVAGNKIDWQMLYEKSLNHDYTERFIGDIKTPVKYATHELREMLADVESSLTNNFIENEVPKEFQDRYKRRFSEGKDDTLEGKILSVADKLDLIYESYGEIQKGNPSEVFLDMFQESLKTIKKFNELASVKYFIKKILPDLFKGEFSNRDKLQKVAWDILIEG